MKIDTVIVGDLFENCYVISVDDKCLVIDPGADKDKIINTISGKEVLAILITHHHFDHIGALEDIKEKYNCPVYDRNNLEEKEYNFGPFSFTVRYNPGHTKDSVSYMFDNSMFVGDFIFKNSIGRCDLEGGSYQEMEESIKKLNSIDKNLDIYPGHGEKTTLFYERENNPYF